uniref:Uncharacterized protein n=1 Tax=Callorhinchus milii TaxID=7868 RepID=A0A4W3JR95_CALMI
MQLKATRECDKESLLEEESGAPPSTLSAFADTCTLHGLSQILGRGGGGGLRRGVWTMAFLASLGLFLHQVVSSAVLYLQHHHVTAVDEQNGREIAFPAITICNINRFRHTALTDADIFHLANMTGLPPKNKAANKGYAKANMEDIFNRTGHQMKEMLKNCNFSGVQCSHDSLLSASGLCLWTQPPPCVYLFSVTSNLSPAPIPPWPGVHQVRQVLHVQLRQRADMENQAGGHGQRAGDHDGHPAGGVSAHLARDW